MLAQAVESVPGPGVLGELAFEQKFDGYRALLFTPTGPDAAFLLQTRRGSLIQDRFPDLVAAADKLPDGLVLDGELVVWDTKAGQLSFEGLQRRTAARGRRSTRWSRSETTAIRAPPRPSCPTPAMPMPEYGARWRVGSVLGLRHLPSSVMFVRRCSR
ncbi:hypothetical protein [Streptomyces sp. NBC_01443]|uniref:ATP-dependent DNA ligase n=1 Tax=Streptomyces sp. NBC_01443 TaxID=2903868 RepID=UPI002256A1FB|nr:hypothetical protein [Streptomyces sp. NBC_01443]MCX4633180.1 hypothetical protein [Streptomyces sp. NBC_01443]